MTEATLVYPRPVGNDDGEEKYNQRIATGNAVVETGSVTRISFQQFFRQATKSPQSRNGLSPYPYQIRLAQTEEWPDVLSVPTGVGKTAAVVLSWLYRRLEAIDEIKRRTSRRLVYCLPTRSLVEQTFEVTEQWIEQLKLKKSVYTHLLMGGVNADDWDEYPERNTILIGTQEMLLSRALNRGYGMSRYRWPVDYALLNNDSQWVLDETHLMGVGATTSVQLAALRDKLSTYGPSRTLWMSSILETESLETVDHSQSDGGWRSESLSDDDKKYTPVGRLITAEKSCQIANTRLTIEKSKSGYASELSQEILQAHRKGTMTLAVVNQVHRAQLIFSSLQEQCQNQAHSPKVFLIHSRFRPDERRVVQATALLEATIDAASGGRIVVATQAVEAGVDISATTLFTELSPWSSIVQRFGRCNRRGSCGQNGQPRARVFWIDIDSSDEKCSQTLALPYSISELNVARTLLDNLTDAAPVSLQQVKAEEPRPVVHVIRRKDVLDLFDTTADVSGNMLDVSRYIWGTEDGNIQVYWRRWDLKTHQGCPPEPVDTTGNVRFPAPNSNELCSVSVHEICSFIKSAKKQKLAWEWNPLDRIWEAAHVNRVRPGMILLLHVNAGGYSDELGWTGNTKHKPTLIPYQFQYPPEANDWEDFGAKPLTLDDHTCDVVDEVETLKSSFAEWHDSSIPWDSLLRAAWWHDVGKSHAAFQTTMRDCQQICVLNSDDEAVWAKSGQAGLPDFRIEHYGEPEFAESRRGFRHELASALAWLANYTDVPNGDLIAYLVAAHHGKVRLRIRSLPNENRPADLTRRFARGIWDNDELPEVKLGNGDACKNLRLSLELMELGETQDGKPSWLARTLALRDRYGPFQLAYLEMLLRVADRRASRKAGEA